MSLQDEIAEMLSWEISGSPVSQALFLARKGTAVPVDPDDITRHILMQTESLAKAVIRLAGAVDALQGGTSEP